MQILTIEQMIEAHWRGCDVRQGETPEAYAMRHEEERFLFCFYFWLAEQGVFLSD